MIELRWVILKPTEYDGFIPEHSVRLADGLDAVLQYRETPHHIHYDPENNISAVPAEWQDVLLEDKS